MGQIFTNQPPDSGHFVDHHTSKDSVAMCDKGVQARLEPDAELLEIYEQRLEIYEKRLEDLKRQHERETNDLTKSYNDKVGELVQKFSDFNIRHCQLSSKYEQARDKNQELEKKLDDVNRQLQDQEEKNKQLYLQMYNKGVDASKLKREAQEYYGSEDKFSLTPSTPNSFSQAHFMSNTSYQARPTPKTFTSATFREEPDEQRLMRAVNNRELTMRMASDQLGVSYSTLYGRYRKIYGPLKERK